MCTCRVAGLGRGGWRSGRVAAAVAMATAEGGGERVGEEGMKCESPRACTAFPRALSMACKHE